MSGDQIQFLSLAGILFFSVVNALLFQRTIITVRGENFWLWGMGLLGVSCLNFGLSPHLGKVTLAIANLSLLLSYLSLTLQIRFWNNGHHNIPIRMMLFTLIYFLVLELIRYLSLPYTYRGGLIHGTMALLLLYLLCSTLALNRRKPSHSTIMLALTFAVEAICAIGRFIIPFIEIVPATTNWFTEESWMVLFRWIWATTNVITYLAIMMYQLEKTTSKKENLESLVAEKDHLLRAATIASRVSNASLLTGSIMHELRQPLSTILLGSTNLSHQLSSSKLQQAELGTLSQYAAIIEKEASRSMTIMDKLEEVYSPDRNAFQRIFIPELVERSLALLENRIQNNQIKIEKLYQSSGDVYGNTLQLESVVTNLASNAIKALSKCNDPRIIKISVRDEEGQVVLSVRDNGPGIPESVLPNIYSLFVSESKSGVGIGLWLSRLITENHQGQIHCKNMTGGGAMFTVSLPAAQAKSS